MTARGVRRSPEPGKRWTKREILALGTRINLPTAGSIIAGLSETSSRELWRRGDFPVPVVKVGRRLVVPMAPVLDLLGISDDGISDDGGLPGIGDGGLHNRCHGDDRRRSAPGAQGGPPDAA